MSDEPLSLPPLPTTTPAVAYTADIRRLGRPSIGVSDDGWLMLAHALSRFPRCDAADRRIAMLETADALAVHALADGICLSAKTLRVAAALRVLAAGSAEPAAMEHALGEMVQATQAMTDELEIVGGFELAYATLACLEEAFRDDLSGRMRGNIIAQQGRAVRQLGLIDMAFDLYAAAVDVGHQSEALDVIARGLLGQAIIAISRGNYPSARDLYERVLTYAEIAREQDLLRSAHHGLLHCGFTSGDLDAAMVHGWNVLRLCMTPDARAEALLNMAEICSRTGEQAAALRVFKVVIGWTSVPRVRLHALSGALQTAIAVNSPDDMRRYQRELAELLPQIADPYTMASIRIEFADSLHQMGDQVSADAMLAESLAVATERSFHELVHLAEQMAAKWQVEQQPLERSNPTTSRRKPRRSEHFQSVLRSLNGLVAAAL